jgi:hypothetical protein
MCSCRLPAVSRFVPIDLMPSNQQLPQEAEVLEPLQITSADTRITGCRTGHSRRSNPGAQVLMVRVLQNLLSTSRA